MEKHEGCFLTDEEVEGCSVFLRLLPLRKLSVRANSSILEDVKSWSEEIWSHEVHVKQAFYFRQNECELTCHVQKIRQEAYSKPLQLLNVL